MVDVHPLIGNSEMLELNMIFDDHKTGFISSAMKNKENLCYVSDNIICNG